MKINVNQVMMDLDNKPIPLDEKKPESSLTLGRAIALTLVSRTDLSDPLRAYVIVQNIIKAQESESGTMELNQSDSDFLRNAVNSYQNLGGLVKGQILFNLQ